MIITPMIDDRWRDRLREAIEMTGKSYREVSLAAGKGHGYVHSIIEGGKDPTIANLSRVCDEVPVSLYRILLGADMQPEDVQLLQAVRARPTVRGSILDLLGLRRDESA